MQRTEPVKAQPAKKKSNGGRIAIILVSIFVLLSLLVGTLIGCAAVIVTILTDSSEPSNPPSVNVPADPQSWEDNIMKKCPVEYDENTAAGKPFYSDALPRYRIGTVTFLDSTASAPASGSTLDLSDGSENAFIPLSAAPAEEAPVDAPSDTGNGNVLDVSLNSEGSVLLWAEYNGTDYDVTIAADGGINRMFATEALFYGFINLRTVSYGGAFHTDHASIFSCYYDMYHKLTDADVSELTISSSAQYLDFMFNQCKSLTTLDLSHFDTSNVLEMDAMFQPCERLTTLDLSSFDTSKVTDMSFMFSGCRSIEYVNLMFFDVTRLENVSNMFADCVVLKHDYLTAAFAPKKLAHVSNHNDFIKGTPYAQTWAEFFN